MTNEFHTAFIKDNNGEIQWWGTFKGSGAVCYAETVAACRNGSVTPEAGWVMEYEGNVWAWNGRDFD